MVNAKRFPMVKRKVKLAQVVCAVYSLNKPNGASKTEIIRFCKQRFGSTCSSKEIDRILERGLDEGLLTSFRKRYRVTKLRFELLWSGGLRGVRKKKVTGRGGKQSKVKADFKKKRNFNRKTKSALKRQVKIETDNTYVKPSFLYQLWKQQFKKSVQREIEIMKKIIKNVSSRGNSTYCKKRKSGRSNSKTSLSRSKRQSLKVMTRRHHGWNKHVTQSKHKMKKNNVLRLKRNHKKLQSSGSVRKINRKKKGRRNSRNSRASIRNSEFGQKDEFHRSIMRQTKHAIVHGKSWDKINFARQRRVRENEELVKTSQLVQKILTQAHSKSWDNLNAKLKHMKEVSCSHQQT